MLADLAAPIIAVIRRQVDIKQHHIRLFPQKNIKNGGDDYIEKPFSYDIVLAKIKSQIRRAYGEYAAKQGEKVVEYAGVQLFVERFEL